MTQNIIYFGLSVERKQFFDFPSSLLETSMGLRNLISRIGFLLACGYFKAAKRFFKPQEYHIRDIEYVALRIGQLPEEFIPKNYVSRARQRHEKQILEFYGDRRFGKDSEAFIGVEIVSMMRSQLKPKLIFWRCVDVIIREHIQLPNYHLLSDIILTALNRRKKPLASVIDRELTPNARALLDGLFKQEGEDRYARYKLTLLKKLSQSTKPAQIRERADDLIYIVELYNSLEPVLPILNLGHEGIRYFANSVIKSDIHSTDTDGYSEAIFATTHLLGFSYAPRIKNLKKQVVYVFKSHKNEDQSDWIIKPAKYINRDIIEEFWDDILRLITTIRLKETTASDIFRRLNSYSKQHRLYQALKAFGQIIKSDFVLRYVDDVELRQAVEKQLNKVELANRFTRAVAVGNPREFTQGDKEEQEIAEGCNRLIKNTIICWNYLFLSQKLERTDDPKQKQNLLSAIASHSVISWVHTNMLGEYDFSDEKLKDSVGIKLPKIAA